MIAERKTRREMQACRLVVEASEFEIEDFAADESWVVVGLSNGESLYGGRS